MAELTPMMKQYLALKEGNPGAILFFRLGDFYEMFFEDAITASRELELTLTARDCGLPERAPMCGVPWHAADAYIRRLVIRGYAVAIAEQTEDPAATRGLVRREVVRVITPGTLGAHGQGEDGQGQQNHFVCAVYFTGKRAGAALCDVGTGEFFVRTFKEGETALAAFLFAHQPKECISNDQERLLALYGGYFSKARPETFRLARAREALLGHFGVAAPEGLGLAARDELSICPAGALLSYLGDTQKIALRHIIRLDQKKAGGSLPLSPATRRSLELTESLHGRGVKGSLLSVLDRTVTSMGARQLRAYVEAPLADQEQIERRLFCVQVLVDQPLALAEARELLAGVHDLERLLGRLSYRSLSPRDCLALLCSVDKAPMARKLLQQLNTPGFLELLHSLPALDDLSGLLSRAISEDAPALLSEGGAIREGYDPALDEARLAAREGRQWISDLEAREKEKTGIKNLKVLYNRVFGYYLEVSKSNYGLVPDYFIRRQTLANAERYTTEELAALEKRALGASDRASSLESQLYSQLLDQLGQYVAQVNALAQVYKGLDALQSLASVAGERRYCRPDINQEGRLAIREGRHPVVEPALPEGAFVPNDAMMSRQERVLIVTGPNMAGKSTYMRQTALIALMAHMGSFVPADQADIPLLDNVFTRIGAQDDLAAGQSTFMVEMSELSHILRQATPKSLVILDEIGRGTGTLDGLSIAWAAVEYLANEEQSGALTLFATHYHELSGMEGALPGVVNLSVLTREMGEGVVFLHKIVRGSADKSFGVHVARMAGVPQPVVKRAREIMARLEAHDISQDAIGRNILEKRQRKNEQIALGETERIQLLEEIASLDVLQMSPMEALNQLLLLKEKAKLL